MHKTYLGYISALRYWRAIGTGKLTQPKPCTIRELKDCACGIREVSSCRYLTWDIAEEPYHLLVSSPKDVNRSARLIPHVCRGRFPKDSFCELGSELVIPTLPLLFAQLAQTEDMLSLAEIGMEF